MAHIRKSDSIRKCENCSGNILPGERYCPCAGRKFTTPGTIVPDPVLMQAHYFQLFRSMRTGSWTRHGHKTAHFTNESLSFRLLAGDRGQFFSVRALPTPQPFDPAAIEFFIFRCELAQEYWRDERARLMGARMELWAAGCNQQKVCDCMGISRESVHWLDGKIRHFVKFPYRARLIRQEYWKLRRRMKSGFAEDVIRRWKHGYKHTQTLEYQEDGPRTSQKSTTFEGGPRVEVRANPDRESAAGARAGA